jgi:6-phosphogluconolactonase
MKAKAFSRTTCALFLSLAVSGLANCGGNSSNPQMPPPNQTPTITSISPNTAVAGGAAFTLRINGTNFVASSTVNFNGSAPATTFVNSTLVTAAIPASSIVSTGTPAVTVTNPAPGGGTSNPIDFTVTSSANPVPAINGLFPNSTAVGCAAFTLGVGGTNFVASSVVNFGGSATATTFFSSTLLTAAIPASSIASTGTPVVTVTNPAPGGGTSNSLTFTATTNTMGAVDPQSIAVDPVGKFAYVANEGCPGAGGNVSMYTINPTTGALASIGIIAAAAGDVAVSVAVDPAGKFAYVANSGGSISMYTIDATTGALASIGPPVPTNDEFTNSVTVDPLGKFAYVASSGNAFDCDFGSLLAYTINPTTGALTSTTGGIIGSGVNGTPEFFNAVAVDPSGKFAYATDAVGEVGNSSSVSMYTINATTGALASIGTIAAGTDPFSVVVDPAGKFAYVTSLGSNDVSMYTIDATTGALASIGTIAAGTGPVSVVVDPSGKFAYVANFNSNDVSMYTINATTGALTSIGTIAAGLSPTSIAVHPSGKFAYVTNSASNDVSMYSIDAATGALTVLGQ